MSWVFIRTREGMIWVLGVVNFFFFMWLMVFNSFNLNVVWLSKFVIMRLDGWGTICGLSSFALFFFMSEYLLSFWFSNWIVFFVNCLVLDFKICFVIWYKNWFCLMFIMFFSFVWAVMSGKMFFFVEMINVEFNFLGLVFVIVNFIVFLYVVMCMLFLSNFNVFLGVSSSFNACA